MYVFCVFPGMSVVVVDSLFALVNPPADGLGLNLKLSTRAHFVSGQLNSASQATVLLFVVTH